MKSHTVVLHYLKECVYESRFLYEIGIFLKYLLYDVIDKGII